MRKEAQILKPVRFQDPDFKSRPGAPVLKIFKAGILQLNHQEEKGNKE